MGADIELTGMGDLIDKLDLMVANSKQVIDETLKAAAAPILADAQQTTAFHDRSGRLRKSLKISKVKSGKNSRKLVWVGDVDAKAQYSWYVEYGHSNVRAHPFMGPAFERHKEEAYRIIKEKLTEALK
jgi:HK97 gp10 family phage protein